MRRLISALAMGFLFLSCKRGSCEGISCLNGGWCKNGSCRCPSGFSGGRCETKWTDGVVGTYAARDQCAIGGLIPDYEFSVAPSNYDAAEIYLQGIGHLQCQSQPVSVLARMHDTKYFTIPRQSLCNRSITLEGSGNYDPKNRELTITYLIEQDTRRDSCRVSAWKL